MPIRASDIDSTLWSAITERLTQIFSQSASLDPVSARVRGAGKKAWREALKRHALNFWMAAVVMVAGVGATGALKQVHDGLAPLALFGAMGLAGWLCYRTVRQTQDELTRHVSPELMRGASTLVALSPVEQRYCETVASLAEADSVLGDSVQQEILQQLNSLLENHRKLEPVIRQGRTMAGGLAVEELKQELEGLGRRRDAQESSVARETMDQSIALCARRLEQASALRPALEQAEAHQELIMQTLAAVQASLARTSAGAGVPEADVTGYRESVERIRLQTSALEDAVAELAAIAR